MTFANGRLQTELSSFTSSGLSREHQPRTVFVYVQIRGQTQTIPWLASASLRICQRLDAYNLFWSLPRPKQTKTSWAHDRRNRRGHGPMAERPWVHGRRKRRGHGPMTRRGHDRRKRKFHGPMTDANGEAIGPIPMTDAKGNSMGP